MVHGGARHCRRYGGGGRGMRNCALGGRRLVGVLLPGGAERRSGRDWPLSPTVTGVRYTHRPRQRRPGGGGRRCACSHRSEGLVGLAGPGPTMVRRPSAYGRASASFLRKKNRKHRRPTYVRTVPHRPAAPPHPYTHFHTHFRISLAPPFVMRCATPQAHQPPSLKSLSSFSRWTGAPASASTAQTGSLPAGCWPSAAPGWPPAAPPGAARPQPAPPPAPPRRRPGSGRWTSPP